MSAPAHIARENGKKGGRPVGSKSAVGLKIEEAKAILIKAYMENIMPINESLIKKAKEGDIPALKELHDRVYGRSMQPVEANVKGNLTLTFDTVFNESSNSSQ